MRISASRLRLLAALVFLVAAQACTEPGGERRGRHGGKEGDPAREPANPTMSEVTRLSANDRFRIHLSDVKIALKLTPLQVPLWQAYESKVLEAIADGERGTDAPPADGAPDQIDRRVRAAGGRAALMEQISAAARKLYASLNDEQKPVADRMLAGTVPALSIGPAAVPREDR